MIQGQRSLLEQLQKHERVDLTPKDYHKKVRLLLYFILFLSLTGITCLMYFQGVTFLSLGVSAAIILATLWVVRFLFRRIKSTSVKGDTIILSTMGNRSIVTSLRSVGKVRSRCLLGVELTTFKYNLDGRKRKTLIINRSNYLPCRTDSFLNKAIAICKKEKANRKLGSVTAN